VPLATGPPGDIPVVAPAPAKDDAMEIDREYSLLHQGHKGKHPIVGFQNGNRLIIMTAEYTVVLITRIYNPYHLFFRSNHPLTHYQLLFKPENNLLLQCLKKKLPHPLLWPLMLSQVASSEHSSPKYLGHILPNLVLVSVRLISQYTCLSITAPTLQDHLRTIENYYVATLTPKRAGAHEALKHDYRLAETKLAVLNTTRSNLVKELVKSDASQVLAERRQRLEEGVTALRVAELLKKVEGIRKRIDGSLQEKQEMTSKRSALIQPRPTSPHKPNSGSPEIIDVDAIMTGHSETAPPTQPRTIKNMIRQVEDLATEVETVAEFLDIGGAKVGEAVENLIPAWEAVTKQDNEEEERKDVERMMTELAEAMQAVRDGVETVQSICMYEEQTDADEEAEMVKLRKEMTLVCLS